jgi:hypothetical protein
MIWPTAHMVSLSSLVNHGLRRSKPDLYKTSIFYSLPVPVVFRSVSAIRSLPSGLTLNFGPPNLNNHALALPALRSCHCPFWSRYPSLTTLGRHESKTFMGLHS